MNRISAKQTTTARASEKVTGKTQRTQEEDAVSSITRRFQEAQDELLKFFQVPSWKRTLVAFVTTVAVGVGVGFVAGTILDWLVVGALAMAVPAFIVFVTYAIGAVIAAYFGGKLAIRLGGSVLTGEADERAVAAYDAVKATLSRLNPFKRAEIVDQPVKATRRAKAA